MIYIFLRPALYSNVVVTGGNTLLQVRKDKVVRYLLIPQDIFKVFDNVDLAGFQ